MWRLTLLLLGACAPDWCTSSTTFAYNPQHTLSVFPDDYFTTADPSTATGLRVSIRQAAPDWLASAPDRYQPLYDDLSTLDGFGTSAGILLYFSAPAGTIDPSTVKLVDLHAKRTVAVDLSQSDDGFRLIVYPSVPLAQATPHALFITREHKAPDGRCISPSATLRGFLTGRGPKALTEHYQQALQIAHLGPGDVSAATVFTTQTVDTESRAIAADITTRKITWQQPPTCVAGDSYLTCSGAYAAGDYRQNQQVTLPPAPVTYVIPTRAWLPLSAPKPWPIAIFGHGLTYDKDQGAAMAQQVAPLGIATIAIDAPMHGEHPTTPPTTDDDPGLDWLFGFLALDLDQGTFDALAFRDHWRESTYDKLQLLQLLAQNGDLDGDGAADVDLTHVIYYGVSLGGTMAIEPLAMSPMFGAAVLPVPGGRIATILEQSQAFSPLLAAILPPDISPATLAVLFPLLQTVIERGDAANYASAVRGPSLLFEMVLQDMVMPAPCSGVLARALGVSHAPPVLLDLGLPVLPSLPTKSNALFQFDRMTLTAGTPPVEATHTDVARSLESFYQARHFLQSWLAGTGAEMVDPYLALGTPPLVQ